MTTMQAVKAAAAKLEKMTGEEGSNDAEHEAALELLGALDTLFAEDATRGERAAPPAVRFMMQDGLAWVSYTASDADGEERDGRAFFKGFHHRAPRKGVRLFMCHEGTKWDGIGGYSVPAKTGWKPVRVL